MSSGLDFGNNSLRGSIPSELAYATNIYRGGIDLHANSLSGSIPTQLGKMAPSAVGFDFLGDFLAVNYSSTVGGFAVNINKLTGTIPTQLGRFSYTTAVSSTASCNDGRGGGGLST